MPVTAEALVESQVIPWGIYGGRNCTSVVTCHNHYANVSYWFNGSFFCHGRYVVLPADSVVARAVSLCMDHTRMGKSILWNLILENLAQKCQVVQTVFNRAVLTKALHEDLRVFLDEFRCVPFSMFITVKHFRINLVRRNQADVFMSSTLCSWYRAY